MRSRIKFSIYLPQELLSRIDAIAASNYRNRTQEIERLLTDAVAREEKEKKDRDPS